MLLRKTVNSDEYLYGLRVGQAFRIGPDITVELVKVRSDDAILKIESPSHLIITKARKEE